MQCISLEVIGSNYAKERNGVKNETEIIRSVLCFAVVDCVQDIRFEK